MDQQFQQELQNIVQTSGASPQSVETQLIEWVQRLGEQGVEQMKVFDLIYGYRNSILSTAPDAVTDAIDDVLDRIWGWCSPAAKLFPYSMTNEIWDEYKRRRSKCSQ